MKRFNKKFKLITILLCIMLLAGCDKIRLNTFDATKEESSSDNEIEREKNPDEIEVGEEVTSDTNNVTLPIEGASPTPSQIQPISNTELMIYTITAEGDMEAVTALIPKESQITPELIVTTVVESMADRSLMIGIESVSTKDDTVIVSFYADQPPLKDVGGGIEVAILDAIAQSLTDNLDDYSKVIYRVEGNAYVSGHIELEIDEVYFTDN